MLILAEGRGIVNIRTNDDVMGNEGGDNMRKFSRIRLFLLFLPLAGVIFSGCGKQEPISQSGFYFDTIISVTLYDHSKQEELAHCFELADLYEQYFSASIPDSDISRINAAGGKPVRVHDETKELLEKGLGYAELSGGKFDITVGRLTSLWDFQAETPSVPDAGKISDAAATVDYQNISIAGDQVTLKNPDAAIDLGGIAKGYIADRMKQYLQSQGVAGGIINLGGNVLAIGAKDNGDAYHIGIQKPFDETGAVAASVKVKDRAVVTSGTYERYFVQDGVMYHHILDTVTGYPIENKVAGVTVICQDAVDADALSTVCFALGVKDGLALVETLDDTEAVFITADGQLHSSSGIGEEIPLQVLSFIRKDLCFSAKHVRITQSLEPFISIQMA